MYVHVSTCIQAMSIEQPLHLKGKCNDFLTNYFYCIIIDIMFNFLILLKMINYLGRYAALTFCILPFYFWFEGETGKYIARGRSKFK